jgi:hypothetical protein
MPELWAVPDETNQLVYPQCFLKVLTAQVVLPLAETEPEKRTERFPVDVNCASIRPAWNALENQEAVSGFHQAFGVWFAALEERSKYLPAICTRNKSKIGNRHDVIDMQAA